MHVHMYIGNSGNSGFLGTLALNEQQTESVAKFSSTNTEHRATLNLGGDGKVDYKDKFSVIL